MHHGVIKRALFALLLILAPAAAHADPSNAAHPGPSGADRADPSIAGGRPGDERPDPARPRPSLRMAPDQPAEAQNGPEESILIGAVRVEGATALAPAVFAPAIEAYLGRPLGPAELRSLATDVANVARRSGYGLATAWVPQQRVANGVLIVAIDEGRIDSVEVSGKGKNSVQPLLAGLANGRPVRTAELERRLLLAEDRAGISLGQPELKRRDGRNILEVAAARERATARVIIDNMGSSTLGPVRARLDVDLNGLLTRDDRLSVGGVVTPLQPREFQFVRLGYTLPIDESGTELSLSAYVGHSKPGATGNRAIDGTSVEAKMGLSHPIFRSRDSSLWASAELAVRDTGLDQAGVEVRSDRIATAGAAISGLARAGEGWIRARLALVQGLGLLGATEEGDPLASRPDGSASFTKLAFSAQYAAPLTGHFSLSLAMEGQLASRALLASEEMGLGGRSFLRAYDYYALAGDQGVAASAELRYDFGAMGGVLRRTQIYFYGDAGKVSNSDGGTGGGRLASAGGGVRLWLRDKIEASFELGLPLTETPLVRDRDPRFWFSVGYGF
jgi:hemolysin activation/secretion protein